MTRYMLDTIMFSHMIRNHPMVTAVAYAKPQDSLCISCLTEGELRYGLARRRGSEFLAGAVLLLFQSVAILPWTSATAICYGAFRAELERQGRRLDAMDLLIAAHALESKAILVTADKAFGHVEEIGRAHV